MLGHSIRLQTTSSRWLASVAVVIVILAAVGMTAAFLYRSGGSSLLPEGTAEGTVHRFLLSIEQRDTRGAYDYLSSSLQEDCSYQYFRDTVRWLEGRDARNADDFRVTLEGTRPIGSAMEVTVRVVRFHFSPPSPLSPPLDGGESSYREHFTLERIGGEWQFVDPPWPLRRCPDPEEETSPSRPSEPASR